MGLDIPQKPAERIVEEKPHRQAGGIGRQAQDVKVHAGVQFCLIVDHRIALAQGANQPFQVRFVIEIGEKRLKDVLISRSPLLAQQTTVASPTRKTCPGRPGARSMQRYMQMPHTCRWER